MNRIGEVGDQASDGHTAEVYEAVRAGSLARNGARGGTRGTGNKVC